jgi:hypothetical protein
MNPIRQSTAFEIAIGPVLDANGVAVTDCVIGDFKIKKTTGNFAALNGSATLAHVSAGMYDLVGTTSDSDTVGMATIAIDDTVNACAPVRLQVIEEAAYDAIYAASAPGYVANQPVDLNTIKTQTVTCAAGVTVLASVGTAATSTAQTGDAYAIVNSGTHGNAALLARTPAAAAITNINTVFDTDFAANYNTTLDAWKVDVDGWLGTTPATPSVAGVPIIDWQYTLGSLITASQFTIASATATTVTLPGTETDDGRYAGCVLSVVGGTGAGQYVVLGSATATALTYNIVPGTCPEPLDNTSACAVITNNRASMGVVLASGTIGSTGNSTTALHLAGLTQGDDELNDYLIIILDVSTGEYHARWIEDWADTGDLATVAILPFTPQNAVDQFWIHPIRQDVSGGSGLDAAGVRAALGFASASYDTDISGLNTKLGTPAGASISADILVIVNFVDGLESELAKVPKSDSTVTWNATALASIQQEATDALNAYDPPTNAEMEARTIAAASYATASSLSSLVTTVGVAGAGLTEAGLSAAQVNAEVLDVLNVDTFAEPTGVPAATTSMRLMLGNLYSFFYRNKITVTATKMTFFGDDDSAEFEKDVSDDGTTYTESEVNAL